MAADGFRIDIVYESLVISALHRLGNNGISILGLGLLAWQQKFGADGLQ